MRIFDARLGALAAAILCAGAPASAFIGLGELGKNIKKIGLAEDEVEAAKRFLEGPSKVEKIPAKSRRDLEALARAHGKGQTAIPPVYGICVDNAGGKIPCERPRDEDLYSVGVGGKAMCPALVRQAEHDLRAVILDWVRRKASTGEKLYDKFIVYLAEQFTAEGKVEDMPAVIEGDTKVADAIATYLPGSELVTMDPKFCGMGTSLRRKVYGHELFHHFDNGRDGSPIGAPGPEAEVPAYDVMKHL